MWNNLWVLKKLKYVFFNNHIYGRKHASISWKKTVHKFSTAISYNQSTFEPCVYSKREKGNNNNIIAFYVGDVFFILTNCVNEKKRLQK